MFSKGFRWFFFTASVLIFTFPAMASDETVVRLGVCRFEYLGDREEALASGISSRFFETLSSIDEHKTSSEELSVILSEDLTESIIEKTIALENLYSERDNLIFTASENELTSELDKFNDLIENKKSEIDALEKDKNELMQPDTDAAGFFPLEILKPDNGFVFERIPGAIRESCLEYGLDFIVYGFIETIDVYEYLEVRMWNNILEKDVYIWRTALKSENINSLIIPGLKGLKTVILGRDWAELSLRAPDNSMIYINGRFTGIGSLNRIMLEPGTLDLELKKAGSRSKSFSIKLENTEHRVIEVELEEMDAGTVIIQTWPAGADIYLDSVWQGITPMRLNIQNEISAVRLTRAGYEERNFFIDDETERMLNMNLKPVSAGRDELVPDSRKRFYTSMGSFILSIPLTSLFSSMIDQSASAYHREMAVLNPGSNGDSSLYFNSNEETDRLFNLNRSEYALYLASTGLNIFLLLDTIIQAVDYVGSVEYFSN